MCDQGVMERYAKIAAQALSQALRSKSAELPPLSASDLEIPPDPKLGDFAFPCFRLAKALRGNPAQIASELAASVKATGQLPEGLTVGSAGPYVNFTVGAQQVFGPLLSDILAGGDLGHYGQLPPNSRGSWVLEYSSPNIAKPLNIYHLRPTALGACLDRLGRYRGFKVVSINHLGDWGKQYGLLTVAFKLWGKELPAQPTIMDLVGLYVRINKEVETQKAQSGSSTLETEAREAFLKLERDDAEVVALWKMCVAIAMTEFNRIYDRLGVKFDHVWGESFYKEQLAPLLARLRKDGLLVESEGAWVVPVNDADGKELPPCILEKSDGATIYATRDVAAALYRFDQFKFDRMTYIVGQEQKLHFKQVFAVLRKMGLPWAERCEHVPFGLYRFKDAKMSTRKGNFVTLEDVLSEAKARVHEILAKRAQDSPAGAAPSGDADAIAEAVAIGACVFFDLHTDPVRDIEFDLDRVLDFEGETGPYLQYAHTRCLSILRKAGRAAGTEPGAPTPFEAGPTSRLQAPEEIRLVKVLGQLPLQIERSLQFAKASQLAHYLIDVTHAFGAFYRECHVLTDDAELTRARLMLVEATRRILAMGMRLLGVPAPTRM